MQASIKNQDGSALIVGLVLLLALTILGVAGMGASRTQLSMAGTFQFFNTAKAAAAGQIDFNLDENNLALGQTVANQAVLANLNAATGTWGSNYVGTTSVPGGGFSLNGSVAAMHYEFDVVIAQTGRPVNHVVRQGAYLIGPGQ